MDSLLRNFKRSFNNICLVNSPHINSLFTCFAESTPRGVWGETLKAFIFSLKNSEGLPPFKCFAKYKYKAIYKNSAYGPSFGSGPYFRIYGKSAQRSMAVIEDPYSVPMEVNKEHRGSWQALIDTFSLITMKCSILLKSPSSRKTNKQRKSSDIHFAELQRMK